MLIRKIIVGCDDGPGTRDAVRLAALLARPERAVLILATAYRDNRAAALDLVTAVECRVPYGTRAEMRVVRSGSPAHALDALAGAEDADVIVIGQGRNGRGHSRFVPRAHRPVAVAPAGFADEAERALLGSLSDAVLRQAPCPVLVVPAAAEMRQAAA